jgi:hypothetical protein
METLVLGFTHVVIVAAPQVALVGLALILLPRGAPVRPAIAVIGVLIVWYATAHVLTSAGAFQVVLLGKIPSITGVAIPLTAGILAIWLAPPVRRLLATEPGTPVALIALQSYRVVGGAFLVLLALHQVPAAFAIPAGVGDILIGVGAWPAAMALRSGRRSRAVAWNVLGILDLVVAVILGVAVSPLVHLLPTTQVLTEMPVALVPTFMVPLGILLHVASLRSLRTAGTRVGHPSTAIETSAASDPA